MWTAPYEGRYRLYTIELLGQLKKQKGDESRTEVKNTQKINKLQHEIFNLIRSDKSSLHYHALLDWTSLKNIFFRVMPQHQRHPLLEYMGVNRLREDVNRKRMLTFRHCPMYLEPPPLLPIRPFEQRTYEFYQVLVLSKKKYKTEANKP